MASREAVDEIGKALDARNDVKVDVGRAQIVKERIEDAANAARAAVGNGVQQSFGTGATRSSSEGKIDYEGHIHPAVIRLYGLYMHEHRRQRDGQLRGPDNWQQGIPLQNYAKSLIRHVQEFHCMWRGEAVVNPDSGTTFSFRTVLCAILFNTMGLLYEMWRRQDGMEEQCYLQPDTRREFGQAVDDRKVLRGKRSLTDRVIDRLVAEEEAHYLGRASVAIPPTFAPIFTTKGAMPNPGTSRAAHGTLTNDRLAFERGLTSSEVYNRTGILPPAGNQTYRLVLEREQ